jgi:hypothetical protein
MCEIQENTYGAEGSLQANCDMHPTLDGALMREDQSESVAAAIYKIKEDIDSLSEQQAEALKTATFVGMTPDEIIEYDKRSEKMTEMIRQLTLLQKTQ